MSLRRPFVAWLLVATALVGSAFAQDPPRIRVLSYNIKHGEGTDGKIDLPRIAAVIKAARPDVVALQEVDVATRRSGGVDQAAELSKLAGMGVAFGRAIDFRSGGFGLAVLSRWPISASEVTPLPKIGDNEQRILLRTEIEVPGRDEKLLVFATHFDYQEKDEERLACATRIEELVAPFGRRPALLVGDLNDVRGSATLDLLQKTWTVAGEKASPTIPVEQPTRQIDYVLFRPAARWKTIEAVALDEKVAADHRPFLAELEFVGAKSSRIE